MTPEEREAMMAQFGGGRGNGAGRAGRQPGQNGRGQQALSTAPPAGPQVSEKIDDKFTPVEARNTRGQVWLYDEAGKKLTETRVVVGISDGQFSQLVSGDLKVGQQVVTNIVLPIAGRSQQNNIFQQPGRGGFGPGGFGGGGQRGGGGGGGRGR
jgi:hypothetical protein